MKRIEWLDVSKYLAMIMVMITHLESYTDFWYVFCSSIVLYTFCFASGYVYRQKPRFREHLYAKFRQLFIPWLVFSTLILLLAQLMSFHAHGSFLEEMKWNLLQIRGMGDEMWFISALFVAYIPFYFFIKWYDAKPQGGSSGILRHHLAVILTAWLLSFVSALYSRLMPSGILPWNGAGLPWHLEYVFRAMFYMVAGYACRQRFGEWLNRPPSVKIRVGFCLVYLLISLGPYFCKLSFPLLPDVFYAYLSEMVGITAVVMFSLSIKPNRYINYIGQNTLLCFAFHGKILSLIEMLLRKYAGEFYNAVLGNTVFSSIFALLFSVLLTFLLIVPIYVVNRFFPFLIGRKPRRNGNAA